MRDIITYVVGDVHGCLQELNVLLEACERDSDEKPHRFVFLGDLVDRGPDSKGVVDRVRDLVLKNPRNECLMGNHERMLLDADEGLDLDLWTMNGGWNTISSYGYDAQGSDPMNFILRRHVAWMRSLPSLIRDEERVYVHGGYPLHEPPENFSENILLWYRHTSAEDHAPPTGGEYVVHGHTPKNSATFYPNRLNLDSGCVFGGRLTAARFTGPRDPDRLIWVARRSDVASVTDV